jgi:ADP-ribosylglycohydrolase
MCDLNKFKGCLIGGVAGDALRYTVEFIPANIIFEKYGERGITEYELCNDVAEISDDTQMTLFTATGLLLGTTRGMTRGNMGDYAECYIAHSYRDWYRTRPKNTPYPAIFTTLSW